ncbi:MAG: Ribonuclease, Rne/Rng family, partial [Verrucomicrobiales bacterium]|nr:Ribonuclease, Rne/Rng family [Verrucomicrobiales bacterium]
MSDRNFSRRRKGPMRFRPPGGLGSQPNRPDKAATEARAHALGENKEEGVFDSNRHLREIERAENVAAGLPPEGVPAPVEPEGQEGKRDFRNPHLDTPAEVQEETFTPVHVPDPAPQGIVESIRAAANKVIKKVQRFIKPVKRSHKEVVINVESLETRVAVLEEGRLE